MTQPIDQAFLEARHQAIDAEIAKLGPAHSWAGEYSSFHVDGGVRIAVAPEAGYIVIFYGMRGTSLAACGRVQFSDDKLSFEPEHPSSGGWSSPADLFHVRWGDRHYLLYENNLLRFCNTVNSGGELSEASQGLMTRSRDAGVYGKPKLPVAYQAFIFDEPVVAKVLSKFVAQHRNQAGNLEDMEMIVLDVGRNRGVFERMRLFRNPPDGKLAIVESVNETTCEASCAGGQYYADLAIGAEFSTRRQSK